MASVTNRRRGEILQQILRRLVDRPEGERGSDVIAAVAGRLSLSAYEKENYETGRRRFDYVARFATVGAVKAGWLLKEKGLWRITEEGRSAVAQFQDPEALFRRVGVLYKEWRTDQPASAPSEELDDEAQIEERATVEYEEALESSWGEIEAYVGSMNPYHFQELVGALLRALGYFVVWIAPPGRDGGVDLVAAPDPLGTQSPRIKVQVKRQAQAVSVDGLRSFMAVLGNDDVGLFVATGGFTRDAKDEARSQSGRKVTLLDLSQFFDLWVEHSPKLPDEDRRRLPLKAVWFLAPE